MTSVVEPVAALRIATLAGLAALALLSGCAAPQAPRFHTLMLPPAAAMPQRIAAGAVAWEVLPVTVPLQVDQPQWVVRTVDGDLALLEQERWIAPLGDEFRAAVSQRLTQILGPSATAGGGRERWNVQIEVQRFETHPGREARLEAVWTLSSPDKASAGLRCRGTFMQGVSATAGYLALAKGHQQAVGELGDAIGIALKKLAAGQAASCET